MLTTSTRLTPRAAAFYVTGHGDLSPDDAARVAANDPRTPGRVAFWRGQVMKGWRFGVLCGLLPGVMLGAVLALGVMQFVVWTER
jgi:hypothetical protein